jgi:hypothetical protein
MENENRITHRFVNDGKRDVGISINGQQFLLMPEEGYRALGLTYEQAQEAIKTLGELMFVLANSLPKDRK